MTDETKEKKDDVISFFGPTDRKEGGAVKSFLPGWYNEHYMELLREEVASIKRRKQRGEIPDDALPAHMQELERAEAKLSALTGEVPKLTGKQKDLCAEVKKELGEEISRQMPTKSQMDGSVDTDIRREAGMKDNPTIQLSAKARKIAKECNIRIEKGGKITRDAACKVWKLVSAVLKEERDVEALRKFGNHPGQNYIISNKHTEADNFLAADAQEREYKTTM